MIERFERFSYAMADISRSWHKITADEMSKFGLKGNHSVYLTVLYSHPEGVTSARLCELCARDKADVSRAMALMEKKGLLVKEGTNQNLYNGVYKLTKQGEEAARYVRERAKIAVWLAGCDMTDEQRAVFYDCFEKVAIRLRTISTEGLPDNIINTGE